MTEPIMDRTIVFVDTETTGLHRDAQAFELAWKIEDDNVIKTMILPHSLYGADPVALEINRYRERGISPYGAASEMAIDGFRQDATDATLVIANPAFDVPHLMNLLGFQVWHYRIIDIESYAMPVLGHSRPQGMHTIFKELTELGYDLPEPDHTAGRDVEAMESAFHILRSMGSKLRASAL
jgi:DNA polymerase III alpha subunit (gram-positive type)